MGLEFIFITPEEADGIFPSAFYVLNFAAGASCLSTICLQPINLRGAQ